ncbi:MAG: MoaD/ThiS family protein [Planctomycetaceae bacterium]
MHASPATADAPALHVAVFAGMAELVGGRTLVVPWPGGTVADVRHLVATMYPAVAPLLGRSAVAVGGRYAADDEAIRAGDDVAIIPPVSGG